MMMAIIANGKTKSRALILADEDIVAHSLQQDRYDP